MNAFIEMIVGPWRAASRAAENSDPLDYDQLLHFDAEELAEGGIAQAYERLKPMLRMFTASPLKEVHEYTDADGSALVESDGKKYEIWRQDSARGDGWLTAPNAFFSIINANLLDTEYRLYALYTGNDLSGIFLTGDQFRAAKAFHAKPLNRPYIPSLDPPSYGFESSDAG